MAATKTILYLKAEKIKAAQINLRTGEILRSDSFVYDERDFEEVFSAIRDSYGKKYRLLLNEDQCFLIPLKVSIGENIGEAVEKEIVEKVPEGIDNLVFDWKVISEEKNFLDVQIFAVKKKFLQLIKQGASKAGIQIEAIEALSYSLARMLEDEKEPVIILKTDNKALAIAIDRGLVLVSMSLGKIADITRVVDFVKENFDLEIKKVVIADDVKTKVDSKFEPMGLSVEQKKIDPILSLGLKEDIKGRQEETLNLSLSEVEDFREEDSEDEGKENEEEKEEGAREEEKIDTEEVNAQESPETIDKESPALRKGLLIIFIIILILGGAVVAYTLFFKGEEELKPWETTQTEDVTSIAEEIDAAKEVTREELFVFSVNIVYHPDQGQMAVKVKEYLEEIGYKDVSTQLSVDEETEGVTLQIREGLDAFLSMLLGDLEDHKGESPPPFKSVEQEAQRIDIEDKFDVIITLGITNN